MYILMQINPTHKNTHTYIQQFATFTDRILRMQENVEKNCRCDYSIMAFSICSIDVFTRKTKKKKQILFPCIK